MNTNQSNSTDEFKSNLTTELLLKLEEAGGVISDTTLPKGIQPTDSVDVWLLKFPLVDENIIRLWHDAYKANFALQNALNALKSK